MYNIFYNLIDKEKGKLVGFGFPPKATLKKIDDIEGSVPTVELFVPNSLRGLNYLPTETLNKQIKILLPRLFADQGTKEFSNYCQWLESGITRKCVEDYAEMDSPGQLLAV